MITLWSSIFKTLVHSNDVSSGKLAVALLTDNQQPGYWMCGNYNDNSNYGIGIFPQYLETEGLVSCVCGYEPEVKIKQCYEAWLKYKENGHLE